jgi:SAM-dependent methyltransferase
MKAVSKQEIRAFWERNPLMTGEVEADPTSLEFFQSHERIYREDVFPRTGFPTSFFPFKPGAVVLDIGCGPGLWTRELARRGYSVHAIDLTDAAVTLTRHSLTLFDLNAVVRRGDAEDLPYADGAFEGVVSHGVIHHTPDTARCVCEIGRVLAPGGIAVVSVYYRNIVLRSPRLTGTIARLIGRWVSLPGRRRESLLHSHDPDEIVRIFDGYENPFGKAFTANEFEAMFARVGLEIRARHRFYFPARAFGSLGRIIRPVQPFLASRFGLMYCVVAEKPASSDRH